MKTKRTIFQHFMTQSSSGPGETTVSAPAACLENIFQRLFLGHYIEKNSYNHNIVKACLSFCILSKRS